MDRLFDDDVFRPFRWAPATHEGPALPIDVTTTADALKIQASLPGVEPGDVEITVEDGTLTISGRTRELRRGDEGSPLVQEIRRGSFSRSVTLPNGLEPDRAAATFEHGILSLRIPKAEATRPRQIRISPLTESAAAPATDSPAGASE
jgi:HSP20 family protein